MAQLRILLVEDSDATRTFVRSALELELQAHELTVVEASGGFEALRLLPRGPYELVITDINMPDINGLELLNFIRSNAQHHHTKVLLISSQGKTRDRERGLALGANAYLLKPFTPDELRVAVTKLLAEPH
jgi:two-component system chemotaxis response regulator CheY